MVAIKKLPQSAPSQNYDSSDSCSGNNKPGVGVTQVPWPITPGVTGQQE